MTYSRFTEEDIAKFNEEYRQAENKQTNPTEKKEYPEIPEGVHEVKIEKLDFVFFRYVNKRTGIEEEKGKIVTWLRIVGKSDPNIGQMMFIDNVIWSGRDAYNFNTDFLSKLDSYVEIPSITEGYDVYYNRLLPEIMESIKDRKEYSITYAKNQKGYPTITIDDVFNV